VTTYQDIITIEAGKRGGKPCIRGLRITVYDVLSWLADGMTTLEIIDDFPELTVEDIQACFAYAADREKTASHLNVSFQQFLLDSPEMSDNELQRIQDKREHLNTV
jgi:uncharacterized protein (DUF433 family)